MSERSAGIVVVQCVAGRYSYLLLRAYRYWDFPKGRIEQDETPLAAARREVTEETGLQTLEFRWGQEFLETEPYTHGKIARYYVAEAHGEPVSLPLNPQLGRPEHHEFRWCEYTQARQLLGPRVQRVLDWAHALIGNDCR